MSEWISFAVRMPDTPGQYLLWDGYSVAVSDFRCAPHFRGFPPTGGYPDLSRVTHWARVPLPPAK